MQFFFTFYNDFFDLNWFQIYWRKRSMHVVNLLKPHNHNFLCFMRTSCVLWVVHLLHIWGCKTWNMQHLRIRPRKRKHGNCLTNKKYGHKFCLVVHKLVIPDKKYCDKIIYYKIDSPYLFTNNITHFRVSIKSMT